MITKLIEPKTVFKGGRVFGDNIFFGYECKFGDNTVFGSNCFFGGSCEFGENTTFGEDCSCEFGCIFGDNATFNKGADIKPEGKFLGKVNFREGCYFGVSRIPPGNFKGFLER